MQSTALQVISEPELLIGFDSEEIYQYFAKMEGVHNDIVY